MTGGPADGRTGGWTRRLFGLAVMLVLCAPSGVHPQQVRLTLSAGDDTVKLAALAVATAPPGLVWEQRARGIDITFFNVRAGTAEVPLRFVVARVDPRAVRFRLRLLTREDRMRGAWTVDSAGADVAFAINAGQFRETGPWGWVVRDGGESGYPGEGPRVVSIVEDTAGRIEWWSVAETFARRDDRRIRNAFQTFPALIRERAFVRDIVRPTGALDLTHRDIRAAICELPDGRLLFLLTRVDAPGSLLPRAPIGPTIPETAAFLGWMGCVNAAMLDGGLSAQMLVARPDGQPERWPGLRRVPLALEAALRR